MKKKNVSVISRVTLVRYTLSEPTGQQPSIRLTSYIELLWVNTCHGMFTYQQLTVWTKIVFSCMLVDGGCKSSV